MASSSQRGTARVITTWLLIGVVVALVAFPLVLSPNSDFGGTDDAATEAIAEISPDVQPWFKPVWSPPGSETQTLLFSLQAAVGAGVIGYYFGLKKGERRHE